MQEQIQQLQAIRNAAEQKLRRSPEFLIIQSLNRLIKDLEKLETSASSNLSQSTSSRAVTQAAPESSMPIQEVSSKGELESNNTSTPELNQPIQVRNEAKTKSSEHKIQQGEAEESLDEMLIRIAHTLKAS